MWLFVLIAGGAGIPVFALFLFLRRRGEPVPVARLFLWAVVFRVAGLVGGPLYEDDYYRYLWDGYRTATTGSPYGAAPEDFFDDPSVPPEFQEVLDGVNSPDLPTIYGPTLQAVFVLAYWIRPASLAVLQVLFALFDLLVIALLLRMTRPRNVLLYAWCPLVIKEVAFTAHPDVVGVALLLAALACRPRRPAVAALLVGVAAAARPFALLFAPFAVRARLPDAALFVAVVAAPYAWFGLTGGTDLTSLAVFARDWEFNSALYGLLTTFAPAFEARVVLGLVFAAVWAAVWRRHVRADPAGLPRGDLLVGALLLLSPVINPWYLLWLLPFATVFPTVWAWTASVAVLLSYATGLNLDSLALHPFAQPLWVRWVEFGLVAAAAGIDLARSRHRPHAGSIPPVRRGGADPER